MKPVKEEIMAKKRVHFYAELFADIALCNHKEQHPLTWASIARADQAKLDEVTCINCLKRIRKVKGDKTS